MSPGSYHLKSMFMVHGKLKSSQPRIILFLALRNYLACVGMFLSDEIFISTKIVDTVIDD